MILQVLMIIQHGWQIKPAEFPYVNYTYYNDIFNYLREEFNVDNLTTKNQVTAKNSSKHDDEGVLNSANRERVDCILFHPLKFRESRFLTKFEPADQVPWITLDFHEIRITIKTVMMQYYVVHKRYMKFFTLYGYTADGWEVIHKIDNSNRPALYEYPNDKMMNAYVFNVSHIGTYSYFKITNDGPDSFNNNLLSLSKLLLFGRVEPGKIHFSPIKLDRKSQYLLNLGMLEAAELF